MCMWYETDNLWSLQIRMCYGRIMLGKRFPQVEWSKGVCQMLGMRNFRGGVLRVMETSSTLRESWWTIRAHPMPWRGQPIALWLQAVTGGQAYGKKATYTNFWLQPWPSGTEFTTAAASPGASQLCWEAMTGGSLSSCGFCLLSLCTLFFSLVLLPNQSGRLAEPSESSDSQGLIHAIFSFLLPPSVSMPAVPRCTVLWLCGPLPGLHSRLHLYFLCIPLAPFQTTGFVFITLYYPLVFVSNWLIWRALKKRASIFIFQVSKA